MDREKLGIKIAYLRKKAGYTQKDLADRIGISDKAVSKWERGLGLPDITYLGKLSILLDTDIDSLLAGHVIHHDMEWKGLLVLPENTKGVGAGTIVYDKPLVYFLISYFLLVGIKQIYISCDEKDQNCIVSEFGDGKNLGIKLYYCGQEMDGVLHNLDVGTWQGNLMVVFGRSFIYGVDQTRFFQRAMAHKDRITILSLPKKIERNKAKSNCNLSMSESMDNFSLSFDDNRKVVSSDSDEKIHTQYDYYEIPILFCPADRICDLSIQPAAGVFAQTVDLSARLSAQTVDLSVRPPAQAVGLSVRSETDLPNRSGADFFTINLSGCRDEHLYTEVLDRGFVEMPMNDMDQVLDVADFTKLLQNACGMEIYCVEEIAWRRGMISFEKLKKYGYEKRGTNYGKYILSLTDRYGNAGL